MTEKQFDIIIGNLAILNSAALIIAAATDTKKEYTNELKELATGIGELVDTIKKYKESN